ncbi:hypothetical protein C2E23DRAFT_840971 [Lenzites betulinus]|nr:hypothetical protein C2E23DRAFT_840971 [Lenzites betulinus]
MDVETKLVTASSKAPHLTTHLSSLIHPPYHPPRTLLCFGFVGPLRSYLGLAAPISTPNAQPPPSAQRCSSATPFCNATSWPLSLFCTPPLRVPHTTIISQPLKECFTNGTSAASRAYREHIEDGYEVRPSVIS